MADEKYCYKCGNKSVDKSIILPILDISMEGKSIKFAELYCCPECLKNIRNEIKDVLSYFDKKDLLESWNNEFPNASIESVSELYYLLLFYALQK